MTNYEFIKTLNPRDMARLLEALIAIAIGTTEYVNTEMREAWLNTETNVEFDPEKWEEENHDSDSRDARSLAGRAQARNRS